MEISITPQGVLVWDARLFQIPLESFDAWELFENQFARLTFTFEFTQGCHQFRMQAHRRNLAVFGRGSTNQRKGFRLVQMQIRPLERRQCGPAQASMCGHQINRLALASHREQALYFLNGERAPFAGLATFSFRSEEHTSELQ